MPRLSYGGALSLIIAGGLLSACATPSEEAVSVDPTTRTDAPAPGPRILVGNSGTTDVRAYSVTDFEDLGFLIPPHSGGLTFPDQFALGPDGALCVSSGCRTTPDQTCEKATSAVLRYDARSGEFLGAFATGARPEEPLYRPYGTAFADDGGLYVASFMTNQVLLYSPDGSAFEVVAEGDNEDPVGLNGPNGVALDGAGHLYVTTEGSTVDCPGEPAEGGCSPSFSKGFPSLLLRYELATGDKKVLAQPEGESASLAALTFGPDGRLYAGDFGANVIRVYDPATGDEEAQHPTWDPSFCNAALESPYTGYFLFEAPDSILAAMGSTTRDDAGTVIRLSGEGFSDVTCLVGPTAPPAQALVRPAGVLLLGD